MVDTVSGNVTAAREEHDLNAYEPMLTTEVPKVREVNDPQL